MALRAFGDGSLFGEVSGTGPLEVVALHGWGRRGSDFPQALNGFSFVALDLPGFGASPIPAVATGAAGYARALEPFFEDLAERVVLAKKVVLVGHSFGGRVAVHLAANQPDRFKGLVLSGVPLMKRERTTRPPALFRLARWAEGRRLVPAKTMEQMRRRYGSSDYAAAEGVMRQVLVAAVNESYEEQLAQLRLPVELLWGADDKEVPVTIAQRAEEFLRARGGDVKLVVEPGVGHLLPTLAPASLHRAVQEMINR